MGFNLLVKGLVIGVMTLCKGITKKVSNEMPLLESQPAQKGTKEYILHHIKFFHCKNPSSPRLSLKKLEKMDLCPFSIEMEGKSDSGDCN